ncbi:response regulator [Neobacillus cucumis]|uniref:response regulator n=1 Tax=Neobacillus cucumis TaxID=1740721 RepID=UPI00203E548B|nr:response regulator [Neobacillus cucumis]MCM3728054.1 response regulator [Neobacillus cucumis]
MKVHKVVIVDDDRIIRKGLSSLIPWEEHGFELVGSAADGEKGFEIVKEKLPQIVISDIQMPFMDGLEMTRAIKEFNPKTKIILLTGYEDFKYAHEAIKLRAFDYLLKPVETSELIDKLKQASLEWDVDHQKEMQFTESKSFTQQEFLKNLRLNKNVEVNRWFDKDLVKFISLGIPEKVIDHLEGTRQRLATHTSVSVPEIALLAIKGIHLIFHEAATFAETWDSAKFYDSENRIMKLQTVDEIFTEVRMIALDLAVFVSKLNENQKHSLVDKAIKFIRDNYHDTSLNLQRVAEVVHVSSAYLSNLFKVEKGINFGDVLLETRMEKAMELFRQTDLKSYEVAEKTGYSNPQYFSSSFKKYTGYSPAEFKKLK